MFGELLRYNLENKKFCCLDVETEGLNYYYSRPWEASWVTYQGNKEIGFHQHFLQWQNLNVSVGAAKATRFNPKIIEEKGEDPKEVINILNQYLSNKDYFYILHNGLGYDCMIINNAAKRVGINIGYDWLNRCYDTHALSKIWKLGWKIKQDKDEFLAQQFSAIDFKQKGLKSNISAMAKEFGIDFDEDKLHEAGIDVKVTFKIFINLINKLEII